MNILSLIIAKMMHMLKKFYTVDFAALDIIEAYGIKLIEETE